MAEGIGYVAQRECEVRKERGERSERRLRPVGRAVQPRPERPGEAGVAGAGTGPPRSSVPHGHSSCRTSGCKRQQRVSGAGDAAGGGAAAGEAK